MPYVIFKKGYGAEEYEMYHNLKSDNEQDALEEASNYLTGDGLECVGHPKDIFQVAEIRYVGNSLEGSMLVLIAGFNDLTKEKLRKKLVRALRGRLLAIS
jgi:hypothetical protein